MVCFSVLPWYSIKTEESHDKLSLWIDYLLNTNLDILDFDKYHKSCSCHPAYNCGTRITNDVL